MARKVILVADPGIDTAFAVALALNDPALDVLAVVPCAGNVSAARATTNVNIIIDRLDPPKWPRVAAALPVVYDRDGTAMHGPDGLGGTNFPAADRHAAHPADRVISELVREHPREVSIVCLGPATTVAHTLDRDPDLARLIDQLVIVGGAWREPGNAGPRTEFHFGLDPEAARRVFQFGLHPVVVPLDVTRKLVLSPSELLDYPNPESRACRFLRQVVPYAIRASANLYGIEGLHLKDVLGLAVVALPGAVRLEGHSVDVETRGELTRGMLVVDDRRNPAARPNAQLGADAAVGEIRQYITRVLTRAG